MQYATELLISRFIKLHANIFKFSAIINNSDELAKKKNCSNAASFSRILSYDWHTIFSRRYIRNFYHRRRQTTTMISIHTLFLFLCHRFSSSYIFVCSVSKLIAKVRSAPGVVVLLAEKVAQSPLCFINVYNPKLLFCLRERHIEKSFSDFFYPTYSVFRMNKVLPNSRMAVWAVPVKSVRLTQWKNRKQGGC